MHSTATHRNAAASAAFTRGEAYTIPRSLHHPAIFPAQWYAGSRRIPPYVAMLRSQKLGRNAHRRESHHVTRLSTGNSPPRKGIHFRQLRPASNASNPATRGKNRMFCCLLA